MVRITERGLKIVLVYLFQVVPVKYTSRSTSKRPRAFVHRIILWHTTM